MRGKSGFGCSKWKEGCDFVFWPRWRERPLTPQQVMELCHTHKLASLMSVPMDGKVQHFFLYLNPKGQLEELEIQIPERQNWTRNRQKAK